MIEISAIRNFPPRIVILFLVAGLDFILFLLLFSTYDSNIHLALGAMLSIYERTLYSIEFSSFFVVVAICFVFIEHGGQSDRLYNALKCQLMEIIGSQITKKMCGNCSMALL